MTHPALAWGGRLRLVGYPSAEIATSWGTDLDVALATHDGAVALPLASGGRRGQLVLGALYERHGCLIPDSQRAKANRAWSGNPDAVDLPPSADRVHLSGRTFFGGYLLHVFGHLLLETLPRFWPDLDYGAFDHVLLYPTRVSRGGTQPCFEPHEVDVLTALGVDSDTAVMVGDRPLQLEEVTVSTSAMCLKSAVDPAFLAAFDRVKAALQGGAVRVTDSDRRVYLSRSRLSDRFRRATNEAEIEALFAATGFQVVHPQELTIAQQVALVGSAAAIAGCDGSALHLAAFATPGTTLLALDSRVVINQFMVDLVRGLDAVHVLAVDAPIDQRSAAWRADVDLVRSGLVAAGLS